MSLNKIKRILMVGTLAAALTGLTGYALQSNMPNTGDPIERAKTYNLYNHLKEVGYLGSIFTMVGLCATLYSERERRKPKLSNSDLEEIFE